MHGLCGLGNRDARTAERKQDAVIDFLAQLPHQPLQLEEVEDEPVLRVQRPFHGHPHAVVVAVQPFAPMTGKRDEVRG